MGGKLDGRFIEGIGSGGFIENKIINGSFMIHQRGLGNYSPDIFDFTPADRWISARNEYTYADPIYSITRGDTKNIHDVFGDGSIIATYTFDDGTYNDLGNTYNGFDPVGTNSFVTSNVWPFSGQYLYIADANRMSLQSLPGNLLTGVPHTISIWFRTPQTFNRYFYLGSGMYTLFGPDLADAWTTGIWIDKGTVRTHSTTKYVSWAIKPYFKEYTWYHLVYVTDGADFHQVYINGRLLDGQRIQTAYSPVTPNYWNIGGVDFNTSYSGDISVDQVRIFNRILTEDEILYLYNESSPIKKSVLKVVNENQITSGATYIYQLIEGQFISNDIVNNTTYVTLKLKGQTGTYSIALFTYNDDGTNLDSIYRYIDHVDTGDFVEYNVEFYPNELTKKPHDGIKKGAALVITVPNQGITYITDVQLTVGSKYDYKLVDPTIDILRCYRYYELAEGTALLHNTDDLISIVRYRATKRTMPSVTIIAPYIGYVGYGSYSDDTINTNSQLRAEPLSQILFKLSPDTKNTAAIANLTGSIISANDVNVTFYLAANAELY